MKPIVSIYTGHDASITVYCPETERFIIYELERISREKHHWFHRTSMENNINTIRKVLKSLKRHHKIKNDFSHIIYRNHVSREGTDRMLSMFNYDKAISIGHLYHTSHHGAHIASAYMQSPFENAFVLSYDGGGDNTCFQCAEMENGNKISAWNEIYQIPSLFTGFMSNHEFIDKTRPLDRAGKIMGLSAYGTAQEEFYPNLEEFSYYKLNNIIPIFNLLFRENKRFTRGDPDSHKGKVIGPIYPGYFRAHKKHWYPAYLAHMKSGEWGKLTAEDTAATIQKFAEKTIIELIQNKYLDYIKKNGNNLILTGGGALNVLINQKIRETFPDINVYVPPNPNDAGISLGLLYHFLIRRNLLQNKKKYGYDLKFSGAPLDDLHLLNKEIKTKIISQDELISKLKSGKILGFIKGNSEVGPRALGNRSILCDPSYSDMKDKLNAKVKFREYFRPFAPMCNIEDVTKYFESPKFEYMEHMSFVATVKENWRNSLKPITHVDNTARLQIVTKESDPIMHSILQDMGRPILNTSFNVQGKPILNSLKDALRVLKWTQLDGVVVYHRKKYYYFDIDILKGNT